MEEKCIDKLGHELSFMYCLKFRSKEKKISVGSVGARYLDIKKELNILPKIIYAPAEMNFKKMDMASTTLIQEYNFINIVNTNLVKDIPSYIATKIISAIFKNKNEKVGDVQKKFLMK